MNKAEAGIAEEVSNKSDNGNDDKKFFGKYRGVVINNIDPEKRGRVQVRIVDTVGLGVTGWAEICTPFGGPKSGMYLIPAIGACVWVEFEHGDPDYPICVGFRWSNTAAVPQSALTTTPGASTVVTETPMQNTVLISDGPAMVGIVPIPGGVALRSGATVLTVTPEGVSIEAPTVTINKLSSPGPVNINKGALVIT